MRAIPPAWCLRTPAVARDERDTDARRGRIAAHLRHHPTSRRSRTRPNATGMTVALTAVGLVVVIALATLHADTRAMAHVDRTLADLALPRAAWQSASRPDARRVLLHTPDRRVTADAVIRPDGSGYLLAGDLATLPPAHTYELWALADTTKIAIANLGPRLVLAPFNAPPSTWGLAITAENQPGANRTTQPPTAIGQIPATQAQS